MDHFFDLDWQRLFVPSMPILEIILRGTLTFWLLFLFLRFISKRQVGALNVADLLVVVLIANASQNGLAGEYTSLTEQVILLVTIVAWSYTFNWLSYRFPALERMIHPPPLSLVKEGQLLRRNMRRELITEEEMMTQLRKAGVEDIAEVESAYMEGDGNISVITYNSQTNHNASENKLL